MEAEHSFASSVDIYQTTQRYIPEDRTLHRLLYCLQLSGLFLALLFDPKDGDISALLPDYSSHPRRQYA
jgi:hypothetical protein